MIRERRLATSLDIDVEAAINKQISMEAKAIFFYLHCASWCDIHGYANAANFFYTQSSEEHQHMSMFYKYIIEVGGNTVSPPVDKIELKFEDYRDVFEAALKNEISITKSINDIVALALHKKDMISFDFLQWFVKEQRGEEETMRRIIEIVDVIGLKDQGIWLIEQELEKFLKADTAKN